MRNYIIFVYAVTAFAIICAGLAHFIIRLDFDIGRQYGKEIASYCIPVLFTAWFIISIKIADFGNPYKARDNS